MMILFSKAEGGDCVFENVMGKLFDVGIYVKQDYSEVFRWYK